MKMSDLYEDDDERQRRERERQHRDEWKNKSSKEKDQEDVHGDALGETGFWGRAGAGVLFQALDTGRILISHRSERVEEPDTWGTWGGAIDENENPMLAAMREASEETGVAPDQKDIIPMYVFSHSSGFRYFNFLVITSKEFNPKLNWESQGFGWFDFGEWPKPLHPGMVSLLNDQKSLSIMRMNAR